MSALPDDPQTIRVAVDVSGLPAVCALARAARDERDAGVPRCREAGILAVEPLYPGPAT